MALVEAQSEKRAANDHTIVISPQQEALMGVKHAVAQWAMLGETTRAVARLGLDETRIFQVQTRLDCFVDEIVVKTVGTQVRKGETLLTVYHPQSIAAQKEYLDALESVTQADAKEDSSEQAAKARVLLAAAQSRLEVMGFTEVQLKTILTAMQPMAKLPIVSPIDGVVIDVAAIPRQRVAPDSLYTIADLSTVWATADLFPSDAVSVTSGQTATLSVPVLQGRSFRGVVDSIVPVIDKVTHTRKVRVRIDNTGRALLPGMYGDVELHGPSRRALIVPAEAVLDRGFHQIVFVDRGAGHLEPTQVVTGQRTEEQIEIVKGLNAGDRVVSTGHFLIDSESRPTYDQLAH